MFVRTAVLCVLGIFLLSFSAESSPVDFEGARMAAVSFLASHDYGPAELSSGSAVAADGRTLAYLFALAPEGLVVIAGDDDLPPVIAYSFTGAVFMDAATGCPVVEGADNPLLDLVKADMRSRLAALPDLSPALVESWREGWARVSEGMPGDDGNAGREVLTTQLADGSRFEQWPPAGSTPTGGWLLSNWTQSAPYNALCPLDLAHGGTRSVAGCPAVAMAMILNYHATIQETALGAGDRYLHNYSGNAYWIPDAAIQYDFPDFETLNGYLETLSEHWNAGSPLTTTDKAALVFACGVAAQQVYAASGSGTFGVDQAYDAYQRFAFADSRLVFDSDPDLFADLTAEMQAAHPAHLAVVNAAWTSGHNVVVDGYNSDGYYHLNFGWGGSYNGWYLLPQGMPYGLTVIEGVILDILPGASFVDAAMETAESWSLASEPNPASPRTMVTFATPASGRARLGIYDVAGRLEETILDGEVSRGRQTLSLSTTGLPAGVHWLRLEWEGGVEARRVVVAR